VNQDAFYVRELRDRLILAKMICRGALMRDESRGAHFKPAFPERNDEQWLKTTIATFDGTRNPVFSFEAVDTSLVTPRKRVYTTK
jgi:succinate dehydrogenase / fumarate reductase flavoprotein subunit